MTPSCFHSWLGTPKGSVAACHGVSRAMAWPASLAGSSLGHLLFFSIFALNTAFLESKPQLFLFFFRLFLTSDGQFLKTAIDTWENVFFFEFGTIPDLSKRGSRWILVAGVSLHVIESTSFSSPTAPQELPRAPGDPQQASPGRFENNSNFLFF